MITWLYSKFMLRKKMYKFYVVLLCIFLKVINVLSGDDNPTSSAPSPNILPLIMINLGESAIKPDKIETIEKIEGIRDFSGKTKFSANDKPNNGQQVFMCAIKDLSDKEPSDIDDYCLYSMKFDETDPLKCTHEPKPIISKYIIRTGKITLNDVPCKRSKNGKIYRLVYKICMTDDPNPKEMKTLRIFGFDTSSSRWQLGQTKYETEVEIYRFCYVENEGVLYTEHSISSLELLKDDRLQQEREKKFSVIFDPSNPFNVPVEKMRKDYNRVDSMNKDFNRMGSLKRSFSRIDSMSKDYKFPPTIEEKKVSDSKDSSLTNTPTIPYQQEKLVPSDDFALALWRKATYSSFNFRRMRTDLVELWDHITSLIRLNAIESNREYYIHTSVFKLTLTQPQTNRPMPEPNVWMKKIYYFYGEPEGVYKLQRVKAIAILMNGYFDSGNSEAKEMLRERCGINMCADAFTKVFPTEGKSVHCCSLVDNGNLQEEAIQVRENLEIEFLKSEYKMGVKKDEPSDTDVDALVKQGLKRRKGNESPTYDPNN